ncbi:Ser/Thr protein kinase RdoA involved in Cpx stress response, MazF antagonist [Paraburkholderia fungorum]|uniref:Ser/Thr protein kinase RdoA involved in Cpx stress response, MazF antagonist n=1 Tax=Paraburkholderia fungorum TaxID=134537 RepID=A0A1H1JF02_9BURK|nr:phosphotransferase [Paraburkholderia fungorum]SDR48505.1 Ser/Thr protein kinase RdoA involved in Cpx stress response, MazF antagonist [Paraburkholderia fungorum]
MADSKFVSSKPLRAVYSTIDGSDLRDFIASAYPFDSPFECSLLRRGFNDVYLLRFSDGSSKIARLSSRRARGESNVAYETSLLCHLKAAGGDVAAPLATHAGALSIEADVAEGNRSLVVFEFLAGDPPGTDLQDTKTMAASLATLHRLARSYSGPASRYVLDLQHLVHRPLQRLLNHASMDEGLSERLKEIASNLIAKIEATTQLTTVFCHGDCHGGNTFMTSSSDGRRVGSFFDFDDGGPGYLAYDLAVYLWAILLSNTEQDLSTGQSERWKYFVDGYREVSPLSTSDYAAIALFVSARHFWFLGEYASRSDEWGSAVLPRIWLQKQADKLEQWSALETPSL